VTKITIAAAVRTPLYLPLYLAEANKFFEWRADYEFTVDYAPKGEGDADQWACEQVVKGEADFAICDPTKSTEVADTSVVASIIARAAFWAVCKYPPVNHLHEFARFPIIYTYHEGMSAHNVAQAIANSIGKKQRIIPNDVGEELNALLSSDSPDKETAAITADLVSAMRFIDAHRGYRLSATWCRHPTLANLMLTGLLTSDETIRKRYKIVTDLIRALNRAGGIARANPEMGATVLHQIYSAEPGMKFALKEARAVVDILNNLHIYPVSPVPDASSWHNTVVVQRTQQLFVLSTPSPNSIGEVERCKYRDYVDAKGAEETELDIVRLFAAFGSSGLHTDLIRLIEEEGQIDLPKVRVVANWYRADEKERRKLQKHALHIGKIAMRNDGNAKAFCVWGGSGSGKSTFVKAIGEAYQTAIDYVSINIKELSSSDVEKQLGELQSKGRPSLVLVDEIDVERAKDWACEQIFSQLDQHFPYAVTFVAVGSRQETMKDWIELMKDKSRPKGDDLMTRIGHNKISVPRASLPDLLAVVAATIVDSSKGRVVPVTKIEKLAVYYLLTAPDLRNPRVLAGQIRDIVDRKALDSEEFRFDDVFTDTEAEERFQFSVQHHDAGTALMDRFIGIIP
jgi:hypothetical protein